LAGLCPGPEVWVAIDLGVLNSLKFFPGRSLGQKPLKELSYFHRVKAEKVTLKVFIQLIEGIYFFDAGRLAGREYVSESDLHTHFDLPPKN